jgi:hypothetical protein
MKLPDGLNTWTQEAAKAGGCRVVDYDGFVWLRAEDRDALYVTLRPLSGERYVGYCFLDAEALMAVKHLPAELEAMIRRDVQGA